MQTTIAVNWMAGTFTGNGLESLSRGYNLQKQRHSTKAGGDIFFYYQNITGWWVSEVARQTQTLGHVLKHYLPCARGWQPACPLPSPLAFQFPPAWLSFPLALACPFWRREDQNSAGAKEAERSHDQPRWRHEGRLVIFLLFEKNWALDGLSLSRLTMPQAAQIFPKPRASKKSLETTDGKIRN